jgi:predicted small metal-binding protein
MIEMTQDEREKIHVLQFLMWAHITIYAADNCDNIKWFNRNQTKNLLKRTVEHIEKEHGGAIKALWNINDAEIMTGVTKEMLEFTEEVATMPYWELPMITQMIKEYKLNNVEKK